MAMAFNLADMWEAVVDRIPERTALIAGERVLRFGELEDRSNRLANWLTAQGVGHGDHVGLHLYNGTEYVEGMLAAYKVRAVPTNVNYRYVEDELRYLFDDADLVAVVHDAEFSERIANIRDGLPKLRTTLAAGDDYEAALAASSPARPDVERSGDDIYLLYTGGTTGMPKGVMWRQEDAFFACFGGGDLQRTGGGPIKAPEEIVERINDDPHAYLPVAPLMHGAGQWTVLAWLLAGGRVVLSTAKRTDPAEIWRLVTEHHPLVMTVIGDPVARPLAEEYAANADRYDVSSLFVIGSGGAPLSDTTKAELNDLFPHVIVADGYGASETGAQANNLGGGRFAPYDENNVVLDEETLEPVPPGSDRLGRVARRGYIPLGYYKDEAKTAATFVEAAGSRWVLTGDMAAVLEDGSIQLFGRGSQCINTGGEKVFPEEVEAVVKAHPDVYDAVVVGTPDARWGEAVTAVVQLRPDRSPSDDDLAAHCRSSLAGYKVPKRIVRVDEVVRSPVGKADYRWAKDAAVKALSSEAV
jgi:acyl-CoA synthetase (AMP-forming)/AMP-acid ligase II